MRPSVIALAAAALVAGGLSAGLVTAPAQAAGGALTLSWSPSNNPSGSLKITASADLGAFGDAEELQISAPSPNSVRVRVVDGDHTLVGTNSCVVGEVGGNAAKDLLCTWNGLPPTPSVIVDMSAASVATTTTVIDGQYSPAVIFTGGSGSDYVQGGAGADSISGGPGNDDLFGGGGGDQITGDDGGDTIDGEDGADYVAGGPGDDDVTGGDGPDRIQGDAGVNAIDSQDNLKDTVVNCGSTTTGSIDYDKNLDIPVNCPVILAPTMPRNVTADAGASSITVSWAPPEFDGNAPLTYALRYKLPDGKDWEPTVTGIDGTDTSYTISGLTTMGTYSVSMRAFGRGGSSDWTDPVTATIDNNPPAPTNVISTFVKKWQASLSWVAPAGLARPQYQIGLRVKDKNNKSWLAWTTLPDKVSGTSIDVGDDLRIVQGRLYQFRVRTVGTSGKFSEWVVSQVRYADNLEPLGNPTLTYSGGRVVAAVTVAGLAWSNNVYPAYLQAAYQPDNYVGVNLDFVTKAGNRYSYPFLGVPTRTKGCWVGIAYFLPAATKVTQAVATTPCPTG